ncbi:MAG: hypothetical protein QW788_02545, partial [Candidatus Hadarchaeales archaeon]
MGDRLYIPLREVEELKREAKGMGAKPLLCFGFRRTSPLVCELGKLRKSGGESYRLERGDGEPLDTWLERKGKCRK